MRKFFAVSALLVMCAVPAFAKWHLHHKPKPSHPTAVHPENENLKHIPKHKVHPVTKDHHV